ncbi:MAG: hypothetical protein ACJ731_00935 [Vicinamibacterales bacterium]
MFKLACSLVFPLALLFPLPAGAHRLDEYLQATRVAIERDRVDIDIDLTPGVSIARQVTAWIDVNHDGEISAVESLTYARQVLSSLVLSIDGAPMPLAVLDAQAPTTADMALGIGTLRLHASAAMPAIATGRHQLTVINAHHPESSVYLANALVPSDTRIHIVGQRRSTNQHSLTIEYDIGISAVWTRISWTFCAVALIAGTVWTRSRLDHFVIRRTHSV